MLFLPGDMAGHKKRRTHHIDQASLAKRGPVLGDLKAGLGYGVQHTLEQAAELQTPRQDNEQCLFLDGPGA